MSESAFNPWTWSVRHSPILRIGRWAAARLRPHAEAERILAASGLPDAPRERIDSIVRQTRLWSAERADIARELVGHARDAIETNPNRSPSDLASDLGNARTVARLLRRSAKRKRSWLWQVRTRTLQSICVLLLVLLASYAVLFVRFNTASPEIRHDYIAQLNERNAGYEADDRALPAIESLWLAYMREERRTADARRTAQPPELDQMPINRSDSTDQRWAFEAMPTMKAADRGYGEFVAWMDSMRPILDRAQESAARPTLGGLFSDRSERIEIIPQELWTHRPLPPSPDPTEQDNLVGVLLPWLGQTRTAARILCADAVLAARAGDASRAKQRLTAVLQLAGLHGQEPFLISNLVGLAIEAVGQDTLLRITSERPDLFSEADLTELCHTLASEHQRARHLDFASERMMFEDVLQRGFTDNGSGDGRLTRQGMRQLEQFASPEDFGPQFDLPFIQERTAPYLGPVYELTIASRAEHRDLYNRLLSIAEQAAQPGAANMAGIAPGGPFDRTFQSEVENDPRFRLLEVLLPGVNRLAPSVHVADARTGAACVALASEIYRRRTGGWPRSIGELVPQLLPTPPEDPFDPGHPLRLAVREGRLIIYSVGTDGDDDHATPPTDTQAEDARDLMKRFAGLGVSPMQSDAAPDGDWILYPPAD